MRRAEGFALSWSPHRPIPQLTADRNDRHLTCRRQRRQEALQDIGQETGLPAEIMEGYAARRTGSGDGERKGR